jgi:outer membrane biosynthesis protein TonB
MVTSDKEIRSKRTAMAISLTLHAAILLLFFFLMAWRAPDPPLPEYGIELNFGTDAAGSGNVQSLAPANNNAPNNNAKAGQPAPQPEPQKAAPEPVAETTPATEVEPIIEPVETESPAVVEKKQPEIKKEEVVVKKEPEKKKEEAVKKEEVIEKKEPEKKPDPKPVVNNEALMTPKKEGAGGKEGGTSEKVAGNNNGDKTGKTGDQGNPEGKLEAKALYGTRGGGNGGSGASYNITGWAPDSRINEQDASDESGKIVFQVKIDDEGRIISVVPIEKTVSPAVVSFYKREVEKLTFSPTSENTVPNPVSTGTITFIIKSK